MNKSKKIKVALVGIGNCASSLVQGVSFYSKSENAGVGLMHHNFAGFNVSDIEFVAAFDVDKRKVGRDLAEAIFQEPNCAKNFLLLMMNKNQLTLRRNYTKAAQKCSSLIYLWVVLKRQDFMLTRR